MLQRTISEKAKLNLHFFSGKKWWLAVIAMLYFIPVKSQDVFLTTNATASFFSETPVENIDATSNQTAGAVNVKSKTVFFKAKMTTFEFKKALMQEHFNENYVESQKYPHATFNGTINEPVDLTKDGTYEVTATGKFTIHGVEQTRTIPGTIIVKNNTMEVTSAFDVKVADHKITIPTIVAQHIAEVVTVKLHATLAPVPNETK